MLSGRLRSQRSLALIAALAALGMALPAASQAASSQSADSFVESIGLNVHTSYTDTPYSSQFETVKQRLEELGIRHVRDQLVPNRPDQYAALNSLADAGIKSTLTLDYRSSGILDTSGLDQQLIPTLKGSLPEAVEAVEGPNEYSTSGDPEWKEHLVAYQERLYEDIKGDPLLSNLPVIGPSIVHGDQEELGDISAFLDYGNIHSYPEGEPPENRMGRNVERAQLNSGTKPIISTETGYTNALNWTPTEPGGNRPISEGAAAVYIPRLFFEYWIRHIARTFDYELVDEFSNPQLDDREAHFGLLRNDLSEKPAFTALRNTIEILEDPGPAFTPDPLNYTLNDEGSATLHSTLLEKRDGTFYLALWRLESVWNPETKETLYPPSEPVTVAVEPAMQSYAVYMPTMSNEPISSGSLPSESLTVQVGPQVTIVELSPRDTTPPQTTISSGPAGLSNDPTPTFAFSSNEAGSSFQCRLDGGSPLPCASPQPLAPLADGTHTFEVMATDLAGNTDPTPAAYGFAIDATPPETTIGSGPAGLSNDPTPTFAFSSNEAGSSFQCRLDGGSPLPCASPQPLAPLADGTHTFEVMATDLAGNTDPTPAAYGFTVDTVPPNTTITSGPSGSTSDRTPTFQFSSSEPASSFQCRVDQGSFLSCLSPRRLSALSKGSHTFEVRATDKAANTDPTPARRAFKITPLRASRRGPLAVLNRIPAPCRRHSRAGSQSSPHPARTRRSSSCQGRARSARSPGP